MELRVMATMSAAPVNLRFLQHVHTTNVVDPKNFDETSFVGIEEPFASYRRIRLPGPDVEYFRIPKDVLTVCLGKSTYAVAV